MGDTSGVSTDGVSDSTLNPGVVDPSTTQVDTSGFDSSVPNVNYGSGSSGSSFNSSGLSGLGNAISGAGAAAQNYGFSNATRSASGNSQFDPFITTGSQDAVSMATTAANTPFSTLSSGQAVAGASAGQKAASASALDNNINNGAALQADMGLSTGDSATVGRFMNPYTSNVLDSQLAYNTKNYQTAQAGLDSQNAKSGAFGNDRSAIGDQALGQNYALNSNSIVSQGLNTAYNNAVSNIQNERNFGLQGTSEIQGALSATGAVDQQTQQAVDTYNYNQFVAQRDWGKTQSAFLSNVLNTVPKNESSAQNINSKSGNSTSSTLSEVGSVVGIAAGIVACFCDARLKRNIRRVGRGREGFPMYEFEYTFAPGEVRRGPLAQQVRRHAPERVVTNDDGYLMVDVRLAA